MEKKLVEHLVDRGLVTRKEIQKCVLRAAMSSSSVVDELVSRVDVDQRRLAEEMADFWGLEYLDEGAFNVQPFALKLIDGDRARSHGVLPMVSEPDGDLIELAVYDVEKAQPVIEEIRDQTGVSPTLTVAPYAVLEREIFRHYQVDGDDATPAQPAQKSRAPARGVVKQARPAKRKESLDEETRVSAGVVIPQRIFSDPDPAPTRQIDITDDNPFMDLVHQSRGEEPTTAQRPAEDFFDIPGAAADPDPEPGPPSAEFDEAPDLRGALDAFEEALDQDRDPEPSPLPGPSSSVDWGDADAGNSGFGRHATGHSGLQPLPRDDYDVEGSGIFPLDRDPTGFFGVDSEVSTPELTIAEIVEGQRKMIRKLQREIDYQKGILQTMAELLIEARVLSRRKLKKRLKALKDEQAAADDG